MSIQVTLSLPETIVESAQTIGQSTSRDAQTVLTDTLEWLWPTLGTIPSEDILRPVISLPDEDVLALADSKMDAIQNERLGALQSKGKATGLAEAERYELLALLQINIPHRSLTQVRSTGRSRQSWIT